MLNIIRLFKQGDKKIQLDIREDIREEHIQNCLKNNQGPLF